MNELSLLPLLSLYLMLTLMGLFSIIVLGWQVLVLRGWRMKNPDGSADSYREQKTHYGIAFADVCVSVPVTVVGIGLVLAQNRWGFLLLALASFWLVWANVMTTATSLRFQRPRIDLVWFLTFPFGALLGVGYLVWFMLCFDIVSGG